MIPVRLLPFTVPLIHPAATVDRYGNTVYDYASGTRTSIAAWIEQASASESTSDGRVPIIGTWKLITNHTSVDAVDRVEWNGGTFELDGPAWPVHTPAGLHHIEALLKRVEG